MSRSLHTLSDAQGTVTFGFLAANVYYFKVAGYLSSKLGIDASVRLREQLPRAKVTFFMDAASSEGEAFAARSAIMRALIVNRLQLESVTVLAVGATATRARTTGEMLGRPHRVIGSAALFQAELVEAVPSAVSKLAPPSGTIRVARSVRPGARSMRPRARTA